jgi:hypothetical protein
MKGRLNMSLEIKWVDRFPIDGGGTRLTVKIDGAEKHDGFYSHDRLEEARKVAEDYLAKAKFRNEPGQRPNV